MPHTAESTARMWAKRRERYGPKGRPDYVSGLRLCRRNGCTRVFLPRARQQRFCTDSCKTQKFKKGAQLGSAVDVVARPVIGGSVVVERGSEADRMGLAEWVGRGEVPDDAVRAEVPPDLAEVLGPLPDPADAVAWWAWAETGRRFLLEEGMRSADAMLWWGEVIALRLERLGVKPLPGAQKLRGRLHRCWAGPESPSRKQETGGVAVRVGRLRGVVLGRAG